MKLASLIILISIIVAPSLHAQTDSVDITLTEISKEVKRISRELPKEEIILGRAVGAAGDERPPYKAFVELVNTATIDEIVALTKHKDPIIRGYAFWGVVIRDKQRAIALKSQFDTDIEWVDTNLHGCIPTPYPLRHFANFLLEIPEEKMAVYFKIK